MPSTSFIYRSSSLYELAMLALYGRHYGSRYRAIAELVPNGSSVLDLCCGPALLYHRYLRHKSVRYTGVDVNAEFIDRLTRRGVSGQVRDLRSEDALPEADYVIMQASLYHFLPDPSPVMDRMLRAAKRQVIISEPIRNLSSSDSRLVALVGKLLTDPGVGNHTQRFNEASLDQFFLRYRSLVQQSFLVAGGREKLYTLSRR
ncbi:MAG TPA: methionine biosynthesis protein MetW [Blastocatellia bacterium]|nr:methionine biosynthesis protein MetW [Blastocatellia bacterium]